MGQISAVLRNLEGNRLGFWCPACREMHVINVSPGHWTFDGNVDRPSFSPSILVTGKQAIHDENGEWTGEYMRGPDGKPLDHRCHSFVTAGRIIFQADCLHALAGQTVDLPPLPAGLRDKET